MAFGCGAAATVLLIPFGEFAPWLKEMNITEREDRFYWLDVPAEAWGVRCDAAGRDGLWRPRFCVSQGGEYSGVDAARIAVNRRDRRAKTARLEVPQRLTMLRVCSALVSDARWKER